MTLKWVSIFRAQKGTTLINLEPGVLYLSRGDCTADQLGEVSHRCGGLKLFHSPYSFHLCPLSWDNQQGSLVSGSCDNSFFFLLDTSLFSKELRMQEAQATKTWSTSYQSHSLSTSTAFEQPYLEMEKKKPTNPTQIFRKYFYHYWIQKPSTSEGKQRFPSHQFLLGKAPTPEVLTLFVIIFLLYQLQFRVWFPPL